MKNLLKKKPQTTTPKPAKKPLFSGLSALGKKKTTTATDSASTTPKKTKPAKKALFGKKNNAPKATNATNAKAFDPAKLLPLLIAVLALVLAGLIYLFFFDGEDTSAKPAVVAEPVAVESVENEAVVAPEIVVVSEGEDAPVVQTVTIDPNAIDAASEPAPLSYDDFIRESETKIYREHDTTPPAVAQ